MSQSKIIITSALPYVNNIPHLGNIIGSVLPADVYNRFLKQRNIKTLYICGADEYGTSTEIKALESNMTPKEICDKYIKIHKQIYDYFQIDFSHFGRTSTNNPQNDKDWIHTKITHEIFNNLVQNNFIFSDTITQLYCNELNMFVSDRFVVGTCSKCNYSKAKGDQCESCNSLLDANEIINPVYKLNTNYKLVLKETEHLFLDLPKLYENINDNFERNKNYWSNNAIGITKSWLEKGLKPRCITRDYKWGTPVPNTEKFGDKFENKVFYNWFDAPIGYISITAQHTNDWKKWWNECTDLVQFMGIDNVAFHTILFSATLSGYDKCNFNTTINSVNYLTYEGNKFSKSENVGIFGDDVMNSDIDSDYWRFYLISQRPEKKQTEFLWDNFENVVNGELNKNYLNFANRVISFTEKKFKQIPEIDKLLDIDKKFISKVNEICDDYLSAMYSIELKDGLNYCLEISHLANKYIAETEPWKIYKIDEQRCKTIINVIIHTLGLINRFMCPFIPTKCQLIFDSIGFEYKYDYLFINSYVGKTLNKLNKSLFKNVTREDF